MYCSHYYCKISTNQKKINSSKEHDHSNYQELNKNEIILKNTKSENINKK